MNYMDLFRTTGEPERKHFSENFKRKAVELSNEVGITQAANDFDIPFDLLDNWRDIFSQVLAEEPILSLKNHIAAGTCGTCAWVISMDGMLTIKPLNGPEGTLASLDSENVPWHPFCKKITTVQFERKVFGGNSCAHMFRDCDELITLDLSNFDTSRVTDMHYMFLGCEELTSLNLSNFDTSHVINMASMFEYCSSLKSLDLSNFDTSHVTDMSLMFSNCEALIGLNLSSFDTSEVIVMNYMFGCCNSLHFWIYLILILEKQKKCSISYLVVIHLKLLEQQIQDLLTILERTTHEFK